MTSTHLRSSGANRASFAVITAAILAASGAMPPLGGLSASEDVRRPAIAPRAIEDALSEAAANRPEIEKALAALEGEERRGLEFLLGHMPVEDLRALSAEFLLENTRLAYRARRETPWGAAIPEAIFLNDVLPYALANETRERWRPSLFEKARPLVEDCRTAAEAAQRLNERLFQLVGVKYSTRRRRADQSPSESIETGLASCTGLSILLADACRAVGVPARLAGIPSWVNKRGNHTWVEVWDGRWHFTGAAEPDRRGLNHTWFQHDASLAKRDVPMHAIWATSFRRTGLVFPMVWAPNARTVYGINVTARYAAGDEARSDIGRLLVRVVDAASGERIAVGVRVREVAGGVEARDGTSRDESADTNDILVFEVPGGREYEVEAGEGSGVETRRLRVEASEETTVTLRLSSAKPDTSPPRAAASIDPGLRERLASRVAAWFAADDAERAAWAFEPELDALLSENEAGVRAIVWAAYRAAPSHAEMRADFEASRVRHGGHESPYVVRAVGERPEGGWPLFIAMHGGGGAPTAVNDSQWRIMQRYYRDQEQLPGYLYLALRAPNDTWNGFYDNYVYPLVERLIVQFLLFGEVDPDKVYAMGYSHGGYGAFAIGPAIPYRFAAVHASAAAPTDGVTSAQNLRHTPFTFMIGERDTAYGRIERCRAFARRIAELRAGRDDIFPVRMEYQPGFGHGGLPDRDKIADMYPKERDTVPRDLTWEPRATTIRDHFWLRIDKPGGDRELRASVRDNVVTVHGRGIEAATVLLDGRLVDFDAPVRVRRGDDGEEAVRLEPSLRVLCETLLARGDIRLAFTARLRVEGLRWPEARRERL